MRTLILACLLTLTLGVPAWAAGVSSRQAEALNTQALEEMTRGYLDLELTGDISLDDGLSSLFGQGQAQFEGIFRKALRSGGLLLVVVLLCGVSGALQEGLSSAGTALDLAPVVGALGITAVAAADLDSLIGLGRGFIQDLSAYSNLLMPTMAGAVAACGAPSGAAARQMATMLFSNALTTAIDRLFLPLVYAYVAASAAYAAVGSDGLKSIADLLRWVVNTGLTGLLLAYTGYITLAGAVAGSADALTVNAAKMAISNMVPVVGGILSDAAGTVMAGAGVLRSALGVFGALGVLAVCLTPFLTLGVHYLVYKAAALLASAMARGRVAGLISSIGGAFGLVLGMTGSCALMLLISLAAAVSMVTP
ncbi:MAG: stage III sporulation protein AE [Oscillospiraceae bacterium]|nr:stage III sporulation protein AE [Oscillospiraceae bacterium]